MDNKLDIILSKLTNLENGQQEIKKELSVIKESVQRLEQNEPENIVATLDRIEKKLDTKHKTDPVVKELSIKVENLESDLRLVKKILSN